MKKIALIALTCGAVYGLLRAGKQVAGRIMYSPEMREYLKEIKRYLVWRYGITDSNKEKQPTRIA